MLNDIQNHIRSLEGQKADLQAQRASSLVAKAAVTGRLDELTRIARHGVASVVEPDDRKKVLAMMDGQIQVDQWVTCHTCDGNGLVPVRTEEEIRKRISIPGRTAKVCPTCHRTRHVAYVTFTGVIPALLYDAVQGRQVHDLPQRQDEPSVPFEVTPEVV